MTLTKYALYSYAEQNDRHNFKISKELEKDNIIKDGNTILKC